MKVGDLVELSSYGKKLKCNKSARGLVGLVLDVDIIESLGQGVHSMSAITVQWISHSRSMHQIRRDLKYAK